MSSTSKLTATGSSQTADPPAAQRLNEWRSRLDAFSDAFDAEVSQILTELASLSIDAPPSPSRPANPPARPRAKQPSNGDRTMEFTLPPTPSAPPRDSSPRPPEVRTAVPQTAEVPSASRQMPSLPVAATPAPAEVAEPNRLAALKERLSQQMAATGHVQSSASRSTEGGRS